MSDTPDRVPPPNDPTRPRCGSCAHKIFLSDEMIECYGVPPTPCIVGMGANLAGQQGLKAELLSPRFSPMRPCCSLYAPGGELPILGPTEPIRRN